MLYNFDSQNKSIGYREYIGYDILSEKIICLKKHAFEQLLIFGLLILPRYVTRDTEF